MNDKINGFDNTGIPMATPASQQWSLLSSFHATRKASYDNDPTREDRVSRVLSAINDTPILDQKTIKSSGSVILKNFSSPHQQLGQKQVEAFQKFMSGQSNVFYAFDIESLGDEASGKGLHVPEIAIQGFQKTKDGLFKADNRRQLSLLVKPDKESQLYLDSLIRRIKMDKFAFNNMSDAERRSIVNLMRYSTLSGAGLQAANLNESTLSHNTIIKSLEDMNGRYSYQKFILNFDMYRDHIQSGYNNLVGLSDKHSVANQMRKYRTFVQGHADQTFFSYNGENFDLETLDRFGKKTGQTIARPQNHVDYFRVLQTAYANPVDFHQEFGGKGVMKGRYFQQGYLSMHEVRRTLGIDGDDAHAAIADVDERGLGGVINKTLPKVHNKINAAKNRGAMEGMNIRPSEFTWNKKEVLKKGDKLFASNGYAAYGDDNLDFQARLEDGKMAMHDVSWNRTVINARTLYTVNGVRELTDDKGVINGHVLELFDSDNDRYSYVTRQGPNSMHQIAQFVQSRFHNVNGMSKDEQAEIRRIRETDLARRRYERMSSLSGAGGESRTAGFDAAKRMYENTEHYEKRLGAKQKNIAAKAQALALAEYSSMGSTDPNVLNSLYSKYEAQIRAEVEPYRSNDSYRSMLDFNSKPVGFANGQLQWGHNIDEEKLFYRMAPRLRSERPVFQEAIRTIEQQIPILDSMTSSERAAARQQRDIAWRLYTQGVSRDDAAGRHVGAREMASWENRGFRLNVDGDERFFSMQSVQQTERAIRRYIQQDDSNNPLTQQHRMTQFINGLHENGLIGSELQKRYGIIAQSNGQINDTVVRIAMDLHSKNIPLESPETTSLEARDMSRITGARNQSIVGEAIRKTLSYQGQAFTMGGKVNLHADAEMFFESLETNHLSGLKANNRGAVESVLQSLNNSGRNIMYDLSVNQDINSPMAKITVYKPQYSTSVREALLEGKTHPRAVEILIPLINQDGMQVLNKQRMIAHTVAVWEKEQDGKGSAVRKSTAEIIGMRYAHGMDGILSALDEDDYEKASYRSNRTLRDSISNLAGGQRDIYNFNDTYDWSGNKSDFMKQSHINVMPAMLHSMLESKELSEGDLNDSAFYYDSKDRSRKVKQLLTIDDVNMSKQFQIRMGMSDWNNRVRWDGGTPNLYVSSVKDGRVQQGSMSTMDMRDMTLYGHYTNMGRPNAIQSQNMYMISDEVAGRLSKIDAYANFNPMVETEINAAYRSEQEGKGRPTRTGVNLKVAYITNEELHKRVTDLQNTEQGRGLLRSEGILVNRGGKEVVDPRRIPTVYEQQAVIAKELMDSMSVTDQDFYDKGNGTFQWHKDFASNGAAARGSDFVVGGQGLEGAAVRPGDVIGRKWVDGAWEDVRHDNRYAGKLVGTGSQVFGVEWSEKPFKLSFAGEKGTDAITPSLRFIEAITGDKGISAMISPNPAKRADFGMMMEGYAKTIIDHVMNQDRKKRDQLLEQIDFGRIGLEFKNGSFMDVSRQAPIDIEDFHKIANQVGAKLQTNTGLFTGILETRMMHNRQYYKSVDGTGRSVIGNANDGSKVYANGLDGTSIGHREMRYLRRSGATQTYEHIWNVMEKQNRFEQSDVKNLAHTIKALVDPDAPEMQPYKDRILQGHEFAFMPEVELDQNTVKHTIMDRQAVAHNLGIDQRDLGHGFWLGLPEEVDININGKNSPAVKTNKIFVPFMQLQGDGQSDLVHLNKLQRQIANINDSIKKYGEAKSKTGRDSALKHMRDIQRNVNSYVNQLGTDTLTSKGMAGERALKAQMPSSGTGTLKLLGPEASAMLGEEMTFISTQQAKDMGIYEHIIGQQHVGTAAESDILSDWNRQQNKNVLTIRYPSKHESAVQFTRIAIDPKLKTGNVLTTAFTGDQLEGDADGDQLHMVYVDEDNVQKEWAALKDKRAAEFMGGYSSWGDYLTQEGNKKLSTSGRNYDLREAVKSYSGQDTTVIRPMEPNLPNEMANKIGKTQIGTISNLNSAIQDFAEHTYGTGSNEYKFLSKFGSTLEQKGIDAAKDGVVITEDMKSPVSEFRSAFLASDWNKVRRIDQESYGGMWSREHGLDEAIGLLDKPRNLNGNLANSGFRVGTSSGINVENEGLRRVHDTIFGNLEEGDRVSSNEFTRMFGRMKRGVGAAPEPDIDPTIPNVEPELDPTNVMGSEARGKRAGAIPEMMHDLTGGWIPENIFNGPNGSRNKKIALLGGLALGGVMGYNILSNDTGPVPPPPPPQAAPVPQSPLPPIGGPSSGAHVSISARGQGNQQQGLSSLVQEGMRRSGYQGQSNMTVNYSDNTNNLSRLWYRDKVEQHM
ncbi:hypothetical protein GZH47_32675 (plasmid) [Paenibacillus rhizovicinus]|uniref:Uncharacterized protein n=1 Tax=Paenibacillus rhizovicinus TaxID=2704463 RepID=A0A6C0PBC3_9BACL|nr:hypothetical protein [Paenibacillus rhizovicinus]QHW35655.1 hypothetical protein GZH47_32675 [Paenibacillus rhizovicinus]